MTRRTGMTLVSLITLIVTILAATACSAGAASKPASNSTPTPIPLAAAPLKPTYTVQKGEVVSQIQFSGRVAPVKTDSLFFLSDGRVRNVYVKQGDPVKVGQVLADLEALAGLQRQQALSDINLRRAQIHLEMAQLQLQQAQDTPVTSATTSHISPRDYAIAMQQYQVELAQIDLDQVKIDNQDVQATMSDAQIVSTMDGQALSVDVFAGTNATAYKAAITIGDVTAMEVVAEPDSTLVNQLVEGMPLSIVASFQPGVSLDGKIRQLPYSGSGASSQDSSVHIQLATDPIKSGFAYGDSVRVTVILQDKKDVLFLPVQAVRTFQGRRFVVVQDGTVQRSVDVKVGITGTDTIEITEGLSEGQIIVSP